MGNQNEVIISVIMAVYNQRNKDILTAAIDSVLAQTFRNFEFIIYNDGSDAEMTDYLKACAIKDERIVYIENPVNHGLAYSLNSCIDVAKGKYLARMDDDDICMPERLMVQYHYMETHPETSYVGCNTKLIDDRGEWGIRKMPEYPRKEDFLKFSPFIHPTVMIRRNIFDETDAYKASKETWRCEDYELFMRLCKLGHKGYNIQQELFYYRECRESYKKRKMKYRIDEMRLRYRNFKELGMLFPIGWCYVLRPIVAGIVPSRLILGVKRLYHFRTGNHERNTETEIRTIQENFESGQKIIRGI